MNDEEKMCPLLAIAKVEGESEDSAVCMEERCAWWLPEYNKRMPRTIVGGRCALTTLACQVWSIADK